MRTNHSNMVTASVPEALTPDALLMIQTIAHQGSFARAAQVLGRVPSAITYAVRRLEESLDVLLFDRSGHRAKLTPAGFALLSEGTQLLAQMDELACRVKRVATGWEMQLSIAVDEIVPTAPIMNLVQTFLSTQPGTQIRLTREVLAGTWDALLSGRVDLAIGATYDAPAIIGFKAEPIGVIDFVFAVSPRHPLAAIKGALTQQDVVKHRAVAIADTSRNLAPRTIGLLAGQDVLTVATGYDKVQAHIKGIGCGYLPRSVVEPLVAQGKLVIKEFEQRAGNPVQATSNYAWRNEEKGRALQWFLDQLSDVNLRSALLQPAWATGHA